MTDFILKAILALIALCVLYTVLVFLIFRLGLVGETRDKRGRYKEKQSLKGKAAIISFMGASSPRLSPLTGFCFRKAGRWGFGSWPA